MLSDLILWLPRRRLKRVTTRNITELEITLATIREEKERAEKIGATALVGLYDATLYLLLLSLDNSVLLCNLVIERNKLRKSVYSKHLILLFSEFFDDFPDLLGSKIKNTVASLPNASGHLLALDKIYKGLRAYRKTHEKEFYKIRNIIAAHRDHNGEKQLTTLESIDHNMIQKFAGDFDVWLRQVWDFITTVIEDYSKSPQMLREICKNIESNATTSLIEPSADRI